jgi:transcriptional regulator with XRE-family HTH domain
MADQAESTGREKPVGAADVAAAPLHLRFREKRRELGWSQQELAERSGVKQSAISGFERHGEAAQALSAESIQQVAEALGLTLSEADLGGARPQVVRLALFYCPNSVCPSVLPYAIGAQTAYRPRFIRAASGSRPHCVECGEVCVEQCPRCKVGISERWRGAFCPACGEAYVEGDDLGDEEIGRWEARRLRLAEREPVGEFRQSRDMGTPAG